MKKYLCAKAAILAFGTLSLGAMPLQAGVWDLQQVESVQLMTAGTGLTSGEAYNIALNSPVSVGMSSPFAAVGFQNEQILDVSLAHALAGSVGGMAAANVFAGNNVKSAPDVITIR